MRENLKNLNVHDTNRAAQAWRDKLFLVTVPVVACLGAQLSIGSFAELGVGCFQQSNTSSAQSIDNMVDSFEIPRSPTDVQ